MHDPTFRYRLAAGLSILGLLLIVDCIRRPRELRRLREYAMLAAVTGAAMAYGVCHDYVTWRISPDYFVIFKGIANASREYSWDVVKLALGATWTVGLLQGAILLYANRPGNAPQARVSYRTLMAIAVVPLLASIACEALLGTIFHRFDPLTTSRWVMERTLGRPNVFTVWGMHIGAYAGWLLGMIGTVVCVRKHPHSPTS